MNIKIKDLIPKNISSGEQENYFIHHKMNEIVEKSKAESRGINEMQVENLYKPELDDLYRLHKLVVDLKRTTVLEFGCGWSSLVLSHALDINRKLYSKEIKNLRRNNPFEHHSIDNIKKFSDVSINSIIEFGLDNSSHSVSDVVAYDFQGKLSTRYEKLPQINPDFIYLDAPDQFNVKGDINGLNTAHNDFMPMSSDLLLIEHFLTPGTIILVDGRTANSRFLKANFQRNWDHYHDRHNDQHYFLLNETSLGIINQSQLDFYNF